jgi:hypothetical protein
MDKKRCSKCGVEKEVDQFASNRSKADGLNWQCRACQSAYHRAHYIKNKDKYIQNSKDRKGRLLAWIRSNRAKCKECGEDHPAVLDFHHRDASKKNMNIMTAVARTGLSKEKIKAEIEKCDVLCSNCHRKLHWDSKQE